MDLLDKELKEQKEMMEVIDAIAEVNHNYFASYFKYILEAVPDLPEDLKDEWNGFLIPYDKLPEERKERHRVWAAQIIERIFLVV